MEVHGTMIGFLYLEWTDLPDGSSGLVSLQSLLGESGKWLIPNLMSIRRSISRHCDRQGHNLTCYLLLVTILWGIFILCRDDIWRSHEDLLASIILPTLHN
jgi:hypothetical protein